jgi:sec-independent protein translocase protein TatA
MPEIGITGIIVILIVALLVFGPKRLPEIGRSLGKGMREFKDSITGGSNDEKAELPPSSRSGSGEGSQPPSSQP